MIMSSCAAIVRNVGSGSLASVDRSGCYCWALAATGEVRPPDGVFVATGSILSFEPG